MNGLLLGVDVGGTFTDAALAIGGRLVTAKLPTTPGDQSEGVMAAVALALERAGASAGDVSRFAHGMTVGTNALLEERGARTALLATEGFTDVIEIGRQARPDLYRLCISRPTPLVPEERRLAVRERMTPDGALVPLDERALGEVIDRLSAAQVEAVAVCLLHSYAAPDHERAVADAVAERMPDVHISASHDVLGVFREYERTSTTVIDAYLTPLLGRYIERLAGRARAAGLPEPEIMQSSGGVVAASEAARHAAWTVLSGPAAGTVGAAHAGARAGADDLLAFDMGGTSCDVSVVEGGRVRQTARRTIGGRVLQLPMVDVHTVGAGGGSVAWVDPGGALRVGPRSAGAVPGPACYGRGGEEATVTDANLMLGYLAPGSTLPGGVSLDAAAAEQAVATVGERARLSPAEAAWGIVRVADQEMERALRVMTVERGVDPRRFALVAFGGAGPMHAARLAEALEIDRVVCPPAAGVLSALGLVVSDRRRDVARSVLLAGGELTAESISAAVREAVEASGMDLDGDGRLEVSFDLRYRGQAFELTVGGSERPRPAELRERFDRAHEERYGYVDPDAELELVNVRVASIAAGAPRELAGAPPSERAALERATRSASFGGLPLVTAVITGIPPGGERIEGPAVCELPETTIVVPPRWSAEAREDGTLVLERRR
jgi:N-methylhydantoinase A